MSHESGVGQSAADAAWRFPAVEWMIAHVGLAYCCAQMHQGVICDQPHPPLNWTGCVIRHHHPLEGGDWRNSDPFLNLDFAFPLQPSNK